MHSQIKLRLAADEAAVLLQIVGFDQAVFYIARGREVDEIVDLVVEEIQFTVNSGTLMPQRDVEAIIALIREVRVADLKRQIAGMGPMVVQLLDRRCAIRMR